MTIHGHDLMLIEVICAVGRICRMNQRLPSFSTTRLRHSPYATICNNNFYIKIPFVCIILFYFYTLFLLIKVFLIFKFFFAFAKVSGSAILPLP